MNKKLAQFIVDAVDCEDDARIYEEYSGRGMFGDTTTGVVVNSWSEVLKGVLIYAAENGISEELRDTIFELRNFRSDNLGRQMIIY